MIFSEERPSARKKTSTTRKILGSRTERPHIPPVATLRRRGPQIQNNAPQRNEDSKGTRLPNPKADRENCVGRSEGATEVPHATQAPARKTTVRVPKPLPTEPNPTATSSPRVGQPRSE